MIELGCLFLNNRTHHIHTSFSWFFEKNERGYADEPIHQAENEQSNGYEYHFL